MTCPRAAMKESANLWPTTLPNSCSEKELKLHFISLRAIVRSCKILFTTRTRTMCKCSALNSGASLNRGRKFITGIPSRHESCQKIRHIPVRHISTPSTCTGTPLKWVENTLCLIFWLRSASVGKMPCDFALGLVWDHSLYRSPAKTTDTVSIAR